VAKVVQGRYCRLHQNGFIGRAPVKQRIPLFPSRLSQYILPVKKYDRPVHFPQPGEPFLKVRNIILFGARDYQGAQIRRI
jgi:hypothetical protein